MEQNNYPPKVRQSLQRINGLVSGLLSDDYKIGHKEGVEIMYEDYAALQAKFDRYEKALSEIRHVHKSSDSSAAWHLNQAQNIAIQALSGGEGDNFTEAEAEFMKECNMHLLTDGGAIIQTGNDEGARLTKDDLLRLSSILYRYANQKEDKQ